MTGSGEAELLTVSALFKRHCAACAVVKHCVYAVPVGIVRKIRPEVEYELVNLNLIAEITPKFQIVARAACPVAVRICPVPLADGPVEVYGKVVRFVRVYPYSIAVVICLVIGGGDCVFSRFVKQHTARAVENFYMYHDKISLK